MKMDPFIEAEEAAGRSVKHCCDLFQVSRAAYYQRKKQTPSARVVADGELVEQIRQVHDDSDGTYGSPRVHRELLDRGTVCGRRRVRRLMRLAGLEGRCKKRWRKTTIQDPAARGRSARSDQAPLRALGGARRPICRRHYLYRHLGGVGVSGHRDRPGQPQGGRLGAGRPHAHRSDLRRPGQWPSIPVDHRPE